MPLIYKPVRLKQMAAELKGREARRSELIHALAAIPKRRSDLERALAAVTADEKMYHDQRDENEKQVRFLERTLQESSGVSEKAERLRKMQEQVKKLERDIARSMRQKQSDARRAEIIVRAAKSKK